MYIFMIYGHILWQVVYRKWNSEEDMEDRIMRKRVIGMGCRFYIGRSLLLAAVLAFGLSGTTTAATVLTITDAFGDGGGGAGRDNGDPLNAVVVESVGGEVWEANNAPGFAGQPTNGVITNLVALSSTGPQSLYAFVPVDGSAYPIGTTYTVQVDAKFRQAPTDTEVRYIDVGFANTGATGFGTAVPGCLAVRVYGQGTFQVIVNGTTEANQNHGDYNDPIPGNGSTNIIDDGILDLDAVNTIKLVYYESINAVGVVINGNDMFLPYLRLPQWMPTIRKAGFTCSSTLNGGGDVPIGRVTYDNFSASADDAEQLSHVDGPVTWGGHTYYLISSAAWAPTQAYAEQLGGNLVTVDSMAENMWIFNKWGNALLADIGGAPSCPGPAGGGCCRADVLGDGRIDGLLLGYYQPEPVAPGDEPAGAWTWVSGSSSFVNFGGSNPNDANSCGTLDLDGSNNNEVGANGTAMAGEPLWALQGLSNAGEWVDFGTDDTVAIYGVVEVDGISISGFRTDWLYVKNKNAPRNLQAYDEVTGELMLTYTDVATEQWFSHTFAGTDNNSARLFVCKEDTADASNVLLAEIDSSGSVINSTDLKTIYTNSGQTYPADYADVRAYSIRYSQYSGHTGGLFIGVNPSKTSGGTVRIHEIDLGLTTLVNEYPISAYPVTTAGVVHLDINGYTGDVYVAHNSMVSANGGMVKIDTVDPDKGTVSVLVDGSTAQGGAWTTAGPGGIAYRGYNNPDGDDTIVVVRGGSAAHIWAAVEEYYLDPSQNDTNGNLGLKKLPYSSIRYPGPAQLDEYSATVLGTRQVNEQTGYRNARYRSIHG